MKKFLLAGALLVSAILLSSCKKDEKSGKTENPLKIEVSEITASTAKVVVSFKGSTPNLVRYTGAADTEKVDLNIEDLEAVAQYATDNGQGITVPYTDEITNLEPLAEYVLAAVAYDASMKCIGKAAVKFSTLAPENQIGDNDSAGELTDRTL